VCDTDLADHAAHATRMPLQAFIFTANQGTGFTTRHCMTTRNLQAGLAAACALALLCAFAAAPVAEAGKMCPSGLLCPDSGWYCCSPRCESCCKNIATGGPFGRRLKYVVLL
jgi:hypothetical protein